ncbi:unnamed protein product [Haemonchus placei]|uniref:Pecanex-like protein n=1 Tax=Haemonchus placei TaxID=6290 RepID=A0A0N4WP71_HAEPC|nr:unnamed protein product [Haemonchus placei]
MTAKTSSERRATFAREPARSVSVPPRKKWFRKASLGRVKSQEGVCDDVTRKLVGAITTWHDIQSSLLRLSIDRSDSSLMTDDSMESSSSEEPLHENGHMEAESPRVSISNPELTSIQIKHMFPELSEHWSIAKSEVVWYQMAGHYSSSVLWVVSRTNTHPCIEDSHSFMIALLASVSVTEDIAH